MLRANAQIHIVANLEKSLAFYQSLGFAMGAAPAPVAHSTFLASAKKSAPKAEARSASMIIPGSEMKFVLLEFSGIEHKQIPQRLYDPGVVRFSIQVRDLDAAFQKAKAQGVAVLSSGAGPVLTQVPRNQTRAVMMQDPDGFIFEFVQADPMPATSVPATSNIYNARASLVVDDLGKAVPFYRDIFGFEAREPNVVNEAVRNLEGTPDAVVRTSATNPPGATNFWVLWEFSKVAKQQLPTRVQDPGSPALSIFVENLSALVTRLTAAGGQLENPDEKPIMLDAQTQGILVRSPDGLLMELLEQKK